MSLRGKSNTTQELSMVFADTLVELISENDKVIALDADLAAASKFSKISKAHPNRFINVGIAEANMIGVAAGLSLRGFIPYVHSFSPFATRRCFDQLYLSGGYAQTNIKVFGSDPGVCSAKNGATHTTFEDIALMRMIPNSMVFDPADGFQLRWLVKELSKHYGIHYIRANRKAVPDIYDKESTFTIGRGNLLKEGNDVLLISMGETLKSALDAAEILEQKGISVSVIDMFTIKPIDRELIIKESKNKRLIVTYENHSINNGLGSSVAEILAEIGCDIPLRRIGINERFGQVGSLDFLKKEYGLTKENVVKIIEQNIS